MTLTPDDHSRLVQLLERHPKAIEEQSWLSAIVCVGRVDAERMAQYAIEAGWKSIRSFKGLCALKLRGTDAFDLKPAEVEKLLFGGRNGTDKRTPRSAAY